ncbi:MULTISPECIES: aldehyde dehydrogenase family protein [unclassified Salinibacterium]|uniref:aldehyde dehydrogenase family protein n=1 Tax=unclassified Salinibacterium TaxID=2632331 RepID=UPI0018CC7CF9|nr:MULTISPECIES: aldehyde dehydrogenase family protein [unclassified Salinibacterium]MBH0054818.1 aldehyde dehydrogenase family protein [Salinibacterium sp. SWN139]MBH0084037.1 aldehyde dehydrogenase family protein [Salinibacterium sp. SWN167]
MTISDTQMLKIAATSGGKDLNASSSFSVINPATGRFFAEAPSITAEQLHGVFEVAQSAFATWKRDDNYRREVLREMANAVRNGVSSIAPILTAEQGKPLDVAASELMAAAAWFDYYAELEIPREVIRDDAAGYEEIFRRPLGVVSAITPWNFPIALAVWKIAPALRAGNTVVVKPSQFTPMSTLALGQLFRGIVPDGVLNVVSGTLGSAMVSDPIPRKVSFTGSTEIGKIVALNAADDLKRVTLELGGNDPAIILPDVNVSEVAETLFWNAFYNNGQLCYAVKRVYAHESIRAELTEALGEIARSVKVDDGTVAGAQLGPINNEPQLSRVAELVEDATSNGARTVAGGSRIDRDGYFFQPTILDNVSDSTRVVAEEQFGPVLPVLSYTDIDDAIKRANKSEYGLTASVWSGDPERAYSIAGELDAGQVSINEHGRGVRPHLPFGGHKWSGVGVENGPWGLHGFTELQVVAGPPRV